MSQIILTEAERRELTQIPHYMSDDDFQTFCSFDEEDIHNIVDKHRDLYNKLGYAVQLFHIRYLGWNYSPQTVVPIRLLDFIAKQLGEKTRPWSFKSNYKRSNTISAHFYEICKNYGYRQMTQDDENNAYKIIAANADVVENRVFIVKEIISHLKKSMIILPKISTIEKWVLDVCNKKTADINRLIFSQFTNAEKLSIEKALKCKGEGGNEYNLHQLRDVPGTISPDTFCELADRIDYIDSLNLHIDLTAISENKRKSITRHIANRRLSSLQRSAAENTYPSVAIYLYETRKFLQDLAIEANDSIVSNFIKKGDKRAEKQVLGNQKDIFGSMTDMLFALDVVSAALRGRKNVRKALRDNGIPPERLDEIIKRARELNRPNKDNLDLINTQYSQIRKYSPRLLDIMEITSESTDMQPLIDALDSLRLMNLSKDLTLPEDAPLDHIEKKFLKYVCPDGKIDKRYYEMATLSSLRTAIRNNTVTVEGSEKYLSFERDLVDKQTFCTANDILDVLSGFRTFEEYIADRMQQMEELLKFLNDNINTLDDLWVEKGRMHLSKLGPAVPEEAEQFSKYIFKELIPNTRLEQILLEVDKWTHFTRHFLHVNLKNQSPKPDDLEKVLASLMGYGTNVGLAKMSLSMNKYSFDQLYNLSLNCITEENLRNAQSEIIQEMRKLWVSDYWGTGNTSSSDGRGIKTVVSSHNSEPNPRHGIDRGCTIYRFVSDKYYVFFTKVIRTARELYQVLDGVLSHEKMTGVPVIEHTTDTGGYSDPLFGLAHLLGFSYVPRIKSVHKSKLFVFRDNNLGGNIKDVRFYKINPKLIKDYYDDILRIAYSIKKGKVSGELVMRKLCNKKSNLRKALVEMGRIEKTLFLLKYYTSVELRRRIQVGLNKGEANNLLAKAVQFGNEGKFTVKDAAKQQIRASTLSLIMDAICLWNAVYLQRSVEYLEHHGEKIEKDLLTHTSPQQYEHINFLGRYDFNTDQSLDINEYRKLKIEEVAV